MPTEDELQKTIDRMEFKLGQSTNIEVLGLFRHYQQLCTRFQVDLETEYEVYLARASVLMLIQAVERNE